jgi:hypothetical protein
MMLSRARLAGKGSETLEAGNAGKSGRVLKYLIHASMLFPGRKQKDTHLMQSL